MVKEKEDKFPIVVTESGLHICVDDILTWDEGYELIQKIKVALYEYKKLTKKTFEKVKPDEPNRRIPKKGAGK